MVTQMRDPVGFEAMATSGRSPLSIENAGDDGVGVKGGQAAHEVERCFVGSNRRRSEARQRHINVGKRAAFPA